MTAPPHPQRPAPRRVMQINVSGGWRVLWPSPQPLSQRERGFFYPLPLGEGGPEGRVRAPTASPEGGSDTICITRWQRGKRVSAGGFLGQERPPRREVPNDALPTHPAGEWRRSSGQAVARQEAKSNPPRPSLRLRSATLRANGSPFMLSGAKSKQGCRITSGMTRAE